MRLSMVIALALAAAAYAPAWDPPAPATAQDCLAGHGDPERSITLGSGETQNLHVSRSHQRPEPCDPFIPTNPEPILRA